MNGTKNGKTTEKYSEKVKKILESKSEFEALITSELERCDTENGAGKDYSLKMKCFFTDCTFLWSNDKRMSDT